MLKLTTYLGAALMVLALAAPAAAATNEDCAQCHDDVAAQFALTPHGASRSDVPSCESCHGDGTRHMEEGDPDLIKVPRGTAGVGVCQSCHSDLASAFEGGEVHVTNGVACTTCHQIHPTGVPRDKLLVEDANQLCATCHQRQVRSFDRPYGHQLGRAGVDCVSCHNPHGGEGMRSVRVDRTGEVACIDCHADKRGPFVFPHVAGTTGDCMSCHEPHGSSNPNALRRARVHQLCLECHSPITGTTLGSQAVSTHDLRSPRYQNCTVCHVAVHGSNSSPTLRK